MLWLTKNASPSSGGQQHTMMIRDVCPRCQSPKFKKNGHTHTGKQNHHCHDCGHQFVQCCEQYLISAEKRGLIERLLVERISLRGICHAVGVTALVPLRVTQSSFYIYAVFCIKKSSWSAKPWSRIPKATAGTCRVVKCTRTKLCTIQ